MAMPYLGSRNNTASQIASTMHFGQPPEKMAESIAELDRLLTKPMTAYEYSEPSGENGEFGGRNMWRPQFGEFGGDEYGGDEDESDHYTPPDMKEVQVPSPLKSANGMWLDPNQFPTNPQFVAGVLKYFKSEIDELPFEDNQLVCDRVNGWEKKKPKA